MTPPSGYPNPAAFRVEPAAINGRLRIEPAPLGLMHAGHRETAGKGHSCVLLARVVVQVVIFETKRADRRHLRDVFAGLRPVEMPGFARQNDDASRRIGFHLFAVEGLTEPDVENT
jgi:hypothetical protein